MAAFLCAVLSLALLWSPGAEGFGILPSDSLNHLEITEMALLNATLHACRALAQTEGTDFTFPPKPYTFKSVASACKATQSSKSFRQAVYVVTYRNVRVDIQHALNASFHFDEEMFAGGRAIIAEGIQSVKASNKQENYDAARQQLGEILHPLQVTDFSSPVCEVESQTICSQSCDSSRWQVSVKVSDGWNGTGVEDIYLKQGNGTMNSRTVLGNAKMVTYEATCCSSAVEIVVVDGVGNVGSCTFTIRTASPTITTAANPNNSNNGIAQTTVSMSPKLVQSSLLCIIVCLLGFHFTY